MFLLLFKINCGIVLSRSDLMTIGDRIKNLRLKKNYTLDQLGKKISSSRQTLYKYEQGIIENIPKQKVESLAKALDTTPSFLYGWEDSYYLNEDTKKIAQDIFENNELKVLFDATKNARPEDLQIVTDLLLDLKKRK